MIEFPSVPRRLRQYFSVIDPPAEFPPLPRLDGQADPRYRGACLKDPDARPVAVPSPTGPNSASNDSLVSTSAGYPFGLSIGLLVDDSTRFVRALSFCRRRRNTEVKGYGRMFRISFRKVRPARPFAIGAQCHFGLGLFVPETN